MQNKQEGFTTKMCKSTECDDYGQILSNTQFCSVYFTIGNSVVLLKKSLSLVFFNKERDLFLLNLDPAIWSLHAVVYLNHI